MLKDSSLGGWGRKVR